MTQRLLAVVAEGRPSFVDALRRAWDDGDAVLPIDPRLPRPAAEALLDTLAPAAVVDADGIAHPRSGGRPVEVGDALVVATSGTTGEPRGAVLTHHAVQAAARVTSAALAVEPSTDCWLACLPLAHVGGLSVVTRALATDTPLRLLARADPAAIMSQAGHGATLVSLVATTLRRIDPSRFRAVVVGGAAAPTPRPPNVVATYGMTETGGGVVYDGYPLAGVEVRAVDGELALRGPMLLRAYRDGADPLDAEGWYRSGDAGEVAPDGRVSVAGRLAEVIVTGGEKVWPGPVETVLATHPAVADVAVVGRVDPAWGHRVVAVIVPHPSGAPPTLDQLREWTKEHLPAYAAPRELVTRHALPRTALGKVRRRQLLQPPTPRPVPATPPDLAPSASAYRRDSGARTGRGKDGGHRGQP